MTVQPITLFLLLAAAFLAGGFTVGWLMISAHRAAGKAGET